MSIRGADHSFRRLDINRLLSKSNYTVSVILIANFVAKAKSVVATFANVFRAPVFAPALV